MRALGSDRRRLCVATAGSGARREPCRPPARRLHFPAAITDRLPVIRRLPRTIALAVIIGIGIFNLYQAVIGWTLSDACAYWNAAIRLREGAELYPQLASVDASEVYRYAPWFAWLAVPGTFLPVQLAGSEVLSEMIVASKARPRISALFRAAAATAVITRAERLVTPTRRHVRWRHRALLVTAIATKVATPAFIQVLCHH